MDNSGEDFLKKAIEDAENGSMNVNGNEQQKAKTTYIPPASANVLRNDVLNEFTISRDELPCGRFYPAGTVVKIRAAKIIEIQSYSMVDDNNFYDVIEKMNDMLSHCVTIEYNNGSRYNYTHLRDGDRFYVIFAIRELTFQRGKTLTLPAKDETGETVNIELIRGNFEFFDPNEEIEEYFNKELGCYEFDTVDGVIKVGVPTIGVQKSFVDYSLKLREENKIDEINMNFMKIAPFIVPDKVKMERNEIDNLKKDFETMDYDKWEFLEDVIPMLNFGIKGVKITKKDGEEVRADLSFPWGASGIFKRTSSSFKSYLKK